MEAMTFPDASFDGLVAYYSVIYTPRVALPALGREFHRVLRPGGALLVVVKEGETEGWIPDPMGSGRETFFANFTGRDRALARGRRLPRGARRDARPVPVRVPGAAGVRPRRATGPSGGALVARNPAPGARRFPPVVGRWYLRGLPVPGTPRSAPRP